MHAYSTVQGVCVEFHVTSWPDRWERRNNNKKRKIDDNVDLNADVLFEYHLTLTLIDMLCCDGTGCLYPVVLNAWAWKS